MATRQELYDRIRTSSRNEVILDEMIRLGFWPRGMGLPDDPAEEIRRRGELERQLRALTTENARLHDAEALKKAAHQRRLMESRQRRKANKLQRLAEREERARQWKVVKEQDILYLGDDVSPGLSGEEADAQRLAELGLPALVSVAELAAAMQVTVGEIRFLAYNRRVSQTSHYVRFAIAKKTGGRREISAPMPRLKRAQRWILENVLEKVPLHRAAHGFRRGRSIVSNAQPHVDSDVVVNVDMQDFFPTVTLPRVRGVFRKLGYSQRIATIFALLCTEPDVEQVQLDRRLWYVRRGPRRLPQGAPTSPAVTNIICRGLDARLAQIAEQLEFRYTRYADDITFSAVGEAAGQVDRLLRRAGYAIEQEGFWLHPKKTRILRRSRRQEVTGLTVNRDVNVSRKVLRRFRALLYHIRRDGPAGKHWNGSPHVMEAIEGFANFVHMVDPKKGRRLQLEVARLIERFGRGSPAPRNQRLRWQPTKKVPPVVRPPTAEAEPDSPIPPTTADDSTPGIQFLDEQPPQRPQPPRENPNPPWWKIWEW